LPLTVALALALALAIALALALAPPPRYLLLLLLVHHRLSIASLSHPLLLNSSTSSSPSSFLRHVSPPPDCLDSNLAWFCTHAPCLVLILLPSFSPSSFIPLFPQTLGSTKPIQSTRHTRSPIESLISSTNANQLSALDIVGGSTCRPFPLPYSTYRYVLFLPLRFSTEMLSIHPTADPPSFEVTLLPLEDDAVARWYLE
ncbi:hypothetical protein CABS01_12547, partial [Colletotrichum abscissum]|uniref:uncharacterized protein n=1 Tax=Colletotrichum abscissum TaxID=1671311 RepID=UPI0027D48CA2